MRNPFQFNTRDVSGKANHESALVYDADCGFCTRSANWLSANGRVKIQPWQAIPKLEVLGLTEEMVTEAAYWVADGQAVAGAESAIARALIERGGPWTVAGNFILARPIKPLASIVYKFIARNRYAMPGGTNACRLPR